MNRFEKRLFSALLLEFFVVTWATDYGSIAFAQDAGEEASLDEALQNQAAEEAETGGEASEEVASDEALTPLDTEAQSGEPSAEDDQSVVRGSILEKVSLDLRNIEVTEALRFLAQKGGINIAISKNVTGRVQLVLNEVPIADVMDIIFVTAGLAYEKHGDIYYIMTEAEYRERFGMKFSDARKVKVFRLKYAVPDQAFALFELLKSEIGRLLVDPESGTVLVMDTPENIHRMEAALAGLEQKRTIRVYNLQYARAVDVEARLKSQLDLKKVGLITSDERTNQIVVETFPERMKEIDALVAALDQKTKEVLIEATIVKIVLNDDIEQGIQWEGIIKGLGKYGTEFLGNHPLEPVVRAGRTFIDDFTNIRPTASNPTAGDKNVGTQNVVFGLLDGEKGGVEVLVRFLRTLGDTKVLSNPKLAVINNQEAKIHVGEKQAYVTTTTTTGQTTTTTAESVTFVDVGIQLSVTPTINDDGYVTMKIKPEISSVVDFLTTPSGNRIPIIDSSLAETSVMVKDGVSIIIGGLRREEETNTTRKTPFLGDIPILGIPFNSNSSDKQIAELLILITPHIVTGDTLQAGGGMQPGDRRIKSYTEYGSLTELGGGENFKARFEHATR